MSCAEARGPPRPPRPQRRHPRHPPRRPGHRRHRRHQGDARLARGGPDPAGRRCHRARRVAHRERRAAAGRRASPRRSPCSARRCSARWPGWWPPPTSSCNTEVDVLVAPLGRSRRAGRRHGVILMVELGDLREGILPVDVADVVRRALELCPASSCGASAPTWPASTGPCPTPPTWPPLGPGRDHGGRPRRSRLPVVSGGNSANLDWVSTPSSDVGRINDLRLGESILLGREPAPPPPDRRAPPRRVHARRRGHRGQGQAVDRVGAAWPRPRSAAPRRVRDRGTHHPGARRPRPSGHRPRRAHPARGLRGARRQQRPPRPRCRRRRGRGRHRAPLRRRLLGPPPSRHLELRGPPLPRAGGPSRTGQHVTGHRDSPSSYRSLARPTMSGSRSPMRSVSLPVYGIVCRT